MIENPNLISSPEENLLSGFLNSFLFKPEKLIILSTLDSNSYLFIPNIDPFKNMFSLPVNSGCMPVPTSKREPILPSIIISPFVGPVTFESIFRRD